MYELKTRYVHAELEKLAFSASGQSVVGSKKSSSLIFSVRVPVGSETPAFNSNINFPGSGPGRAFYCECFFLLLQNQKLVWNGLDLEGMWQELAVCRDVGSFSLPLTLQSTSCKDPWNSTGPTGVI